MLRGALRIAAALFVAPGTDAPPDAVEAGSQPELDPAAEARRLFAEGSAKYELGDCKGAIELWEQAYELLSLGLRGQLQVPLANAHVCAYEGDEDPEHLRRAQVLFGDYLAALDAADQQTRTEVEGLLAQVTSTLAEVQAEAERREQELDEREAVAREQAAKAVVIEQMQDLDPWTDEQRRRFRIFNGVGGSLIGLGAAGLGVMATGLALGESVDVRGSQLTVHDPYSKYAQLRETGRDYNAMAAVGGALGGALLVSGVSLIVVAAVERKRAKLELERSRSTRIRPTGAGLELQF
jgi:hypothetical protein